MNFARFVCGEIWIILKYLPPIILVNSAYNYSTMLSKLYIVG
jgi:hypothetical protein